MLTSLEPPSPASLAGPHEVERSLQTTPRLPGALPLASPPESYPTTHRDAAQSSRFKPGFKGWLQTRFQKTNKNQASQPLDQLSTKYGRLVHLRFDSQSQPTANIANKGPARMAAGQRVRVSVFFFDRQYVCGTSDEASQRTVARPVNMVRCSVCLLALLFILCRSEKEIPRR